jgi:hypothetical protein
MTTIDEAVPFTCSEAKAEIERLRVERNAGEANMAILLRACGAETIDKGKRKIETMRKALKQFSYETNWDSPEDGVYIWDVEGKPFELAQAALGKGEK